VSDPIVLSHLQARALLEARGETERRLETSPDLGRTTVEVVVGAEGVIFPGAESLPWAAIEKICAAENNCFLVDGGEAHKIVLFSEHTFRVYSLLPTEAAPTVLLSGIPMHRVKGTDPYHDTLAKVATIRPVVGHVLDTATGLGYTAIEAARTAEHVTTCELDPAVLEVAQLNPWSRELFDHPKITQRIGDSTEVIEEFADGTFARIIHDPPAFRLAGQLYGAAFYRQLHRVLHRGGRLFHYVGNPGSGSGRNITRGVVRRLQEAGFSRVVHQPRAFGVVAYK